MPYTRNDDQYQTVVNVNWMKGKHNVRAGTDIYFQALNHVQPELSGGDNFGARGGFRYGSGPTQIQRRTVRQPLQRVGRVPARAARSARPPEPAECAVHDADAQLQLLRARSVAGDEPPDRSRTARATSTSRCRRRDDRGLERYNPDTNMMEIGGVGSVPMDLGIKVEKGLFAPRVGVTFRATPTMVLRGGFGITNDPYSLARPMRTNHPDPAQPDRPGAEPLLVGRADGRRRAADRRSGSRERHHPHSRQRDGVHAARRVQPRLHQVVERGGAEGAEVGLRRRSGLRGDAADRSARRPRTELVADRRRPGRPAAEPAVRPHRADHAAGARSATPSTMRCRRGSTGASPMDSRSASATRCRSRPASRARRAATARRGS